MAAWEVERKHSIDKAEKLTQRFWQKVQKGDGCWEWQAAKHLSGYGALRVQGKTLRAHRIAWMVSYGSIPAALCVLHKCDNRSCVRPDHLFLGTQADNAADKRAKGRAHGFPGELQPNAKLTEAQAREILTSEEEAGLLAERFQVHPTRIYRIRNRTTWRHL